MGKVHVTIDGIQVYVPDTYTVLEAAKEINIHIPTLCFLKDVSEIGCCRMCLVEVKGSRALQAACGYPVKDGMEVRTHTPEILKVRQKTLELILSNHPARCQSCTRTNSCELQILTDKMDVHFENYVKYQEHITSDQPLNVDDGISIQRDPNRCILCRRCVSVCNNIQTVGAISAINRGYHTVIGAAENRSLDTTVCVNCGQCINVCPTGALQEPIAITAAMIGSYVDLYRVKLGAAKRKNYSAVHKDFGYKGSDYRLKRSAETAAHYTLPQLEACLQVLLELDQSLKSQPVAAQTLLETALFRLALAVSGR